MNLVPSTTAPIAGLGRAPAQPPRTRLHEGDGEHFHELSEDERGTLREFIWKLDNVELTTVGIDIGSSTSHLMFSRLRLQRRTQLLSSQFVVIERRVLWRSPIVLTPFRDDNSIDAAWLGGFIDEGYARAGLTRAQVDSGAVILTGEAILRRNAQAIAQLFAADAGKFVCASAGHHLECVLAAHGSGAVALSRASKATVLNVDIGGGTTKLALIEAGAIVDTCAFAVGGRLLALDDEGRLTRLDAAARLVADTLGLELRLGQAPGDAALARVVEALAEVACAHIGRRPAPPALAALADRLLLTDKLREPLADVAPAVHPDPARMPAPTLVTFSGGVAEYLYGRESARFGDIAQPLAERMAAAARAGRLGARLHEPEQGIRATVIGASQFSVQVSGKTLHLSDASALPIHNAPALFPALVLGDEISAREVATAIGAALAHAQPDPEQPLALVLPWRGDPLYRRLRTLADGIVLALAEAALCPRALLVLTDGDLGRTLGFILQHDSGLPCPLVSLDGIALRELDYVDVGAPIAPSGVVPLMIKSLLFAHGDSDTNTDGTPAEAPTATSPIH